jgi:hypothetical protein
VRHERLGSPRVPTAEHLGLSFVAPSPPTPRR